MWLFFYYLHRLQNVENVLRVCLYLVSIRNTSDHVIKGRHVLIPLWSILSFSDERISEG